MQSSLHRFFTTRIRPLFRSYRSTLYLGLLLLILSTLYFRSNNDFLSGSIFRTYESISSSAAVANIPTTGVQISRILTNNSFTYAFLAHDEDSYQVKDENIRALEPGLSALWVHKLKDCCAKRGMVLDIGSHFGYYSLLGNSMGCRFIAVEPVPLFRNVLHFNLFLNNVKGTVYPYALGTENGELTMVVPKHGILGTAHVIPDGEKEERAKDSNFEMITVEQHRLDELIKPEDVSHCCMMKIDVEGFEPSITLSARKIIESRKIPHIMMEFSPGFVSEGLLEMLKFFYEVGYEAIEIPWHLAKMNNAIPAISPDDVFHQGQIVDISTKESRQAFIDKVMPVYNTNLWLHFPANS